QAEDGIRDGHVTGVQTCALPISGLDPPHPVCRGWAEVELAPGRARGLPPRADRAGAHRVDHDMRHERGWRLVVVRRNTERGEGRARRSVPVRLELDSDRADLGPREEPNPTV